MRIGYARVSTEDQRLDLQREALRGAGCTRIYQEKRSAAAEARPALERALKALRPGDVLVVWRLDRLGRSLQDLIAILHTLEQRGVGFCSLFDVMDTTTPTGKLLFHIAGAFAEFERSLISERTRAGMATAKRRGRRVGRPPALDSSQVHRVQCMAILEGIALPMIAARMAVSLSTVRRALAPVKAYSRHKVAEHATFVAQIAAERGCRGAPPAGSARGGSD